MTNDDIQKVANFQKVARAALEAGASRVQALEKELDVIPSSAPDILEKLKIAKLITEDQTEKAAQLLSTPTGLVILFNEVLNKVASRGVSEFGVVVESAPQQKQKSNARGGLQVSPDGYELIKNLIRG